MPSDRLAIRFLAGLLIAGAAGSLAGQDEVRPLVLGRPVERPINLNEHHAYSIPVERGQFVLFKLERRGIDTYVELEMPGPVRATPSYAPTGPYGILEAVGVAETSGIARLTVRAEDYGIPGSYHIVFAESRPAGPVDHLRAEAQRIAADADYSPQTAEARALSIRKGAEAVALYRKAGDQRGVATNLTALSYNLFFSGKPREALAGHQEGLELFRRLRDPGGQASTENGIGMALSALAEYTQAIDHYQRALGIQESLHDPFGQARLLSNMSVAYGSLGDNDRARDCLERSLPLRRAAGDKKGEAYTLSNLADYAVRGDDRRALELKTRAVELAVQTGESALEASLVSDMGQIYVRLLDDTRALEMLERARGLQRKGGFPRLEGRTVSTIGAIRARQGQWREALSAYAEALELHRRVSDRGGEALTQSRIGEVYLARAEEREARDAFRHSLELSRAIANPVGEAGALVWIARLERRFGRPAEARLQLDEALRLIESRRQRFARPDDRAATLAAWQGAYRLSAELYLERHAASPDAGFDALAFRETERSRARSLLESIVEAKLNLAPALPEDLRRREEELTAALSGLQKKLAVAGEDRRGLEEEVFRVESGWSQLGVEIRARDRRYATIQYPDPASAARIRALLDPATALVSLVMLEGRSAAFVLTQAGLSVTLFPATSESASEKVGIYVGLLAGDSDAGTGDLARRLSEDWLASWWKALPRGTRRLIIVPDGDLFSLPFEALPQPGSAGRRLIDDLAVSYVPSATVLAELVQDRGGQQPPGRPTDLLVLAAPPGVFSEAAVSFDGEPLALAPLPHAEDEARAVALYGGPDTRVRRGSEASEQWLKAENLSRYGGLHFATHALLARGEPSRSALVLASSPEGREDGLLQAREIYFLRLRSSLVVLSGCRTARGRILAGEGVQGLAHAFFHAGARTVVASLWDVSDRRSADLMEAFYRHLAEGEGKADALRSAKLELLRREPSLPPRYWAPFVLIGEPSGTVPLRAPSWLRRLFS